MPGIGGWARQTPDAPAFISMRGAVPFAEVDARQQRLAGYLHSLGLEEADRIAILSKNRAEVIEVATGSLRAGIVPVPVNALLTQPEIEYILEDSGAKVLFTDRIEEVLPGLERVITFGSAYERCLEDAAPVPLSDHVRARPMHYTSGTTGHPKGVYVAPYDDATAAGHSERFRTLWGLQSDDVHLVCSPLAHSAPLRFSMRTLEAGGAVVVPNHFDAEETLGAISLFRVTSAFMVPTHLERILSLSHSTQSRYNLSTMRSLWHAGAPIREATKRSVIELFPQGSVWEFYGSTEGQATRISTTEWLRKPGSVGQAHPGASVYVMDDDFEKVPTNEIGRIWVLDEQAESWVYWGDPAKTANAWRDGAFRAGDLGRLDEDGYLYLAGRDDDTIITGGVNVYPQEVEAALGGHPEIAEVVVFAAPNEDWGQEVRARVVLAPGGSLTADELKTWARERLASFKIPKTIEFTDELEHTATGKIRRPRQT